MSALKQPGRDTDGLRPGHTRGLRMGPRPPDSPGGAGRRYPVESPLAEQPRSGLGSRGPLPGRRDVTVPGTASHYDTEGFFRWDARAYTDREVEQTRQIISWSRSTSWPAGDAAPGANGDVRLDATASAPWPKWRTTSPWPNGGHLAH